MEELKVKQVIVMRADLNMRKGKMIAQGSHAAMMHLLELFKAGWTVNDLDPMEKQWFLGNFRKICLQVNSEEELLKIYDAAKFKGLRVHRVDDQGLTEFHGVKTLTCIAIGPNLDSEIDEITGNLKLL
jgi:PTH2 family peptidyl-tRNA hydrolase